MAAIRGGSVVFYRSIFDTVRDFLHDEALAGQERVLQRYNDYRRQIENRYTNFAIRDWLSYR